jgi:hypothetical protein
MIKIFLCFIAAAGLLSKQEKNISPAFIGTKQPPDTSFFSLSFVTVGFGSNMFEMEPVFEVKHSKFIYTNEEVWLWKDEDKNKLRKDTLLTGDFRHSSADLIVQLISGLKDTVIYKTNAGIMSGSAGYLTITTRNKKVRFDLHNASDRRAEAIVAILNSYVPEGMEKMWITGKIKEE